MEKIHRMAGNFGIDEVMWAALALAGVGAPIYFFLALLAARPQPPWTRVVPGSRPARINERSLGPRGAAPSQ